MGRRRRGEHFHAFRHGEYMCLYGVVYNVARIVVYLVFKLSIEMLDVKDD